MPTFIDGRSDQLFLGDFMPTLYESIDKDDTRAFAALLDRYEVDWRWSARSRRATRFAAMSDWIEVHRDATAAVFARKTPRR